MTHILGVSPHALALTCLQLPDYHARLHEILNRLRIHLDASSAVLVPHRNLGTHLRSVTCSRLQESNGRSDLASLVLRTGRPESSDGWLGIPVRSGEAVVGALTLEVLDHACALPEAASSVLARTLEQWADESRTDRLPGFVGEGAAAARIFDDCHRAACTSLPVLIQGETGSGKEIAARGIHLLGPRARGSFVPCSAPEIAGTLFESEFLGHEKGAFTGADRKHAGFFEQADGGTLFIDEIGDLDLASQAKLLRVLESKDVRRVGGEKAVHRDVRIVAATNKDLEAMCAAGSFREDLLERLNVFPILLPPLRERREDIEPLLRFFLFPAAPAEFDADALAMIKAHSWRRNIRQFKNFGIRLLVYCEGRVTPETVQKCLPREVAEAEDAESGPFLPLDAAKEQFTIRHIKRALQLTKGDKIAASELLGIAPRTLRHARRQISEGRAYVPRRRRPPPPASSP